MLPLFVALLDEGPVDALRTSAPRSRGGGSGNPDNRRAPTRPRTEGATAPRDRGESWLAVFRTERAPERSQTSQA